MGQFIITGFSDEIAPELDIQMDELEKLGIFHIEMRGVNGRALVDHDLGEVREIKKQLDSRGFKISSLGSPIGKVPFEEDFEKELVLFRHVVAIALILEAPFIRVFSFYFSRKEKAAAARDEVIKRFHLFIKELEGTDIILLHENAEEIYGDSPERCLDLIRSVNSGHFKALIDIGAFVQNGVKDVFEAYKLLKEEILYVHIKDGAPGEEHFLPIGQGTGRALEILTALSQDTQDYFLSLEPHLKYMNLTGVEQFKLAHDSLLALLKKIPQGGKQ